MTPVAFCYNKKMIFIEYNDRFFYIYFDKGLCLVSLKKLDGYPSRFPFFVSNCQVMAGNL